MNQEHLMKVLLVPRVTEKTMLLGEENNSYVFKVLKNASKPEIKKAVEMMFEVEVDAVRTSNVKGKLKRLGMHLGRRSSWKKAMVKLAPGHKIDLMESE